MNIDAEIWTPLPDDDGGENRLGEVIVETIGDEEIGIHLRVGGDVVASAQIDRFMAGMLAGHLYASAAEAVKA